ncbi:MAG: peptidase, partial [Croceimicrobium sp.]
ICLNGSQYPLNDLSLDLLSIYFGKADYELPEFKNISLSEAELRPFIGLYKSDNFPLDISIEVKEGELFGQASGQPSFPLSATDKNVFEFKAAGIRMEFKPEDNIMNFEQGGAKIQFKR